MSTSILDHIVRTADGTETTLRDLGAHALLIVNVASKCGLTPQYAQLEELQREYADRGLLVVGFPSNQFNGQEPGTDAEIQEFCSTSFGVTFPVLAKIEVNGVGRHPVYADLTEAPDGDGVAGDVQWNFEKFVVDERGAVVARIRPRTTPDDPSVIAALEAALPARV